MRALLLCLLIFSTLFSQTFQSSQKRVNIIELYSSQGCSSCPPADQWLNKLKNNSRLFKEFIPLAFHVTYWDFLGWKDSFAQKAFDQRQYQYSLLWGKQNVYTPQFVIDGKEYRKWFSNKGFPRFDLKKAGILTLTTNEKELTLTYEHNRIKDQSILINTAILGFDYKEKIKRGENKGETLAHQFVVLGFKQESVYMNKSIKITYSMPSFTKDSNQKALVVYLTLQNGETIQAVGGYLK